MTPLALYRAHRPVIAAWVAVLTIGAVAGVLLIVAFGR